MDDETSAATLSTYRGFKFRAYPNKDQESAMLSLLETHRRLYNRALAERRDAYQDEGRTVTYYDQSAELKNQRKSNPFLASANFTACQRTLKRLDRAFADFFRRVKAGQKPGYPRFRGFGRFDSVEFKAGNGARLARWGTVSFQHVGEVKIKQHRAIEGEIKTITFKRDSCGDWYVIFGCDIEMPLPELSQLPAVGIDLGLKSFLVTSDGDSVTFPRFYRRSEARLKRAQRQLCRKQHKSSNRRKAAKRLARIHQHIGNQRRDFLHKVALGLVRRYGCIAHEDLNVQGIARTHLAKSTYDAGWSLFLTYLSHKAACAGVKVTKVSARHTTQICSQCGSLAATRLELSDRTYTCDRCGYIADRDYNAAVNVRNRALSLR